jgi:DNA-binding CsgD family transcriptional regulator
VSANSERLLQLLLKGIDKLDLPLTVRQAEGLAREVTKELAVHALKPRADHSLPHVTDAQYDVWLGIVAGESVQASANRLCVTAHTVKTQRHSLYKRLGVSTTAGAVAQAALCGLVTEESARSAGVPR